MSLLRKLTVKPWEHAGAVPETDGVAGARPPGRIALNLFLAVISVLFLLFSVSHRMRMGYPDWKVLAEPGLLWLNTGLLVLASAAMQLATIAARDGLTARTRGGLAVAAGLTLGFIGGQYAAWREMLAAGYYASGNPSYAFFYLFTGVHALHVLGGLWFLIRALRTSVVAPGDERLPLRISLCTTYWHFLLLVWLLLFYLLLNS